MSDKGTTTKKSQLPAAAMLCLFIIILGLIGYWINLQTDLSVSSCDTLNNIMEQQRFTFASKLRDQKNVIKTYAVFFESAADINRDELLTNLSTVTSNSTFDYVTYATPDGKALENTGVNLDISDRDYFKLALLGETVVADPISSKVNGEDIVAFATPIYAAADMHHGAPAGVLVGVYKTENLAQLLMPSFGGRGYTYIVTESGKIIVKTKSSSYLDLYSNLFESFAGTKFLDYDSSADILANVAAGRSGHALYKRNGEKHRMHYAPVGINNWYVFSIAAEDAIAPRATGIMRSTTSFIYIVLVLVVIGLSIFIRMQNKYLAELRQTAFVDTLTGSPNKKRFRMNAAEILATSTKEHAFILLDIDKFKVLNDTLGFACGDALLVNISQTLGELLGDSETFGRCDSDEYLMLITYNSDDAVKTRLQYISSRIEEWFKVKYSSTYNLVICIGVYVIANPMESINSISDRTRHAHKLTKGREESSVCFYNEEMRRQILYEKKIENSMHGALENGDFLLYLQPKFHLDSEKLYGAEALARWDSGDSIIVYPDQFIAVFEKNGFITKLDMYMLEKACQTICGWLASGIAPVPISINFSRMHLKNPRFVQDIAEMVKTYNVPPGLIEIELTESTMLNNEDVLLGILTSLHECGFTLSMDDFGSGYSSLGLLKNLPVDVIKLDKSFFADCSERGRAVTVVASIISMSKKLGIKTVAEGVETREQIEFLRNLGCDLVQGFYYARPMAADDLTAFLGDSEAGNH